MHRHGVSITKVARLLLLVNLLFMDEFSRLNETVLTKNATSVLNRSKAKTIKAFKSS